MMLGSFLKMNIHDWVSDHLSSLKLLIFINADTLIFNLETQNQNNILQDVSIKFCFAQFCYSKL